MRLKLTLFFTILLTVQVYAYECKAPATFTDYAICDNPDIMQLDKQMNTLLSKVSGNEIISQNQKIWLETLNRCQSLNCLRTAYDDRIGWFENKKYENFLKNKIDYADISTVNTNGCLIFDITSAKSEIFGENIIALPKESWGVAYRDPTLRKYIYINNPNKCTVLLVRDHAVYDIYHSENSGNVIVLTSSKKSIFRGLESSYPVVYQENIKNTNATTINGNTIGPAIPKEKYTLGKITFGLPTEILLKEEDVPKNKEGVGQLVKQKLIAKMVSDYATAFSIDMPPHSVCDYTANSRSIGSSTYYEGCGSYVQLHEMIKLPEGLGGATSIILYLPMGLTPPANNTHSSITNLSYSWEYIKELPLGVTKKTEANKFYQNLICYSPETLVESYICKRDSLLNLYNQQSKYYQKYLTTHHRNVFINEHTKWLQQLFKIKQVDLVEQSLKNRILWYENRMYEKIIAPTKEYSFYQNASCDVYYINEYNKNNRSIKNLDIFVNSPQKCVVIAIDTYETMNWNIRSTQNTRIDAVLLSTSKEKQTVAGVTEQTIIDFNFKTLTLPKNDEAMRLYLNDHNLLRDNYFIASIDNGVIKIGSSVGQYKYSSTKYKVESF